MKHRPLWFVTICFALVSTAAWAQQLAVPERTPLNNQMVLSVRDSQAVWATLERTGIPEAVIALWKTSGGQTPPELQAILDDMQVLAVSMGVQPTPAGFFGSAVKGFDLYVCQPHSDAGLSLVLNTRFARAEDVVSVASFMEAKARSSANDLGIPAEKVVIEGEFEGVPIKSLPNATMHFATIEDVLVLASSRPALENALSSPGSVRLADHAGLAEGVEALAGAEGEAFFFLDGEMLRALIGNQVQASAIPAEILTDMPAVIVSSLDVTASGLQSSTYYAYDGPSTAVSLALQITPSTQKRILRFADPGAILGYSTNMLEPIVVDSMLDQAFARAQSSATMGMSPGQMLSMLDQQLGFSLRDDMVPALGPEIGFFINSITLQSMVPDIDAAIVAKVRDQPRLMRVLTTLETKLSQQASMRMAQTNPGAEPPRPVEEEYRGATIHSFLMPGPMGSEAMGLCRCITPDGYLVVSHKTSSIRRALDALEGGNLSSAQAWEGLGQDALESSNQVFLLDFRAVATLVDSVAPMVASFTGGSQEAMQAMNSVSMVLRRLGKTYSASANTGDAVISRVVLEMAP